MRHVALFLLVGCGPKAPPAAAQQQRPEPVWIEVNPSTPALCVPFLGEPAPQVVSQWTAAVGALEARDLEVSRSGMPPVGTHPALDAVHGVQAMFSGDVQQSAILLDGLLVDAGADPCLLSASATAQQLMGQLGEAEKRISLARTLAPEDPEIALMFAFLAPVEQAGLAFPALEKGAIERPDRRAFAVALGIAAITTGDAAGAIRWLKQAYAQGETAVAPMLLAAYRGDKRTDDYLRLASQLGLPLADGGALATADAPTTALHAQWGLEPGQKLVATLQTTMGTMQCDLFDEVAPITVANFVGLANGTQPWTTPAGTPGSGPLYANVPFHRVIPGFMVQTGDPEGTGSGGPGYQFIDEFDPAVVFDTPGLLAMANKGPESNGSQFFVTEAPAIHLNGSHTIFGRCTDASVGIVEAIARSESPATLIAVTITTAPKD